MKNLIFWAAIIFIAATSCKKTETPVQKKPFIKTITYKSASGNVTAVNTYTYNANNQIVYYTIDNIGSTPNKIILDRNSAGQVTKIYDTLGRISDIYLYTYTADGRVSKRETWIKMGTNVGVPGLLVWKADFSYSATGCQILWYADGTTFDSKEFYTLTPDGKNIAKIESFNSSNTLTKTTHYTGYDAKNNFYLAMPFTDTKPVIINANNYTTHTITLGSTTDTYLNTYTYDGNNYPLSRTETKNGAANGSREYTYEMR